MNSRRLAFRSGVRASGPVRQFDQRNYGQADFGVGDFAGDGGKRLQGVLALALSGDEDGGVEDQSHAGGLSGSRWLSTAASTPLAKSGSMVAVESSGTGGDH